MASTSEKDLLKQITDLTRQIERRKRSQVPRAIGYHQTRKYNNSWARSATSKASTAVVKKSRQWHKTATLYDSPVLSLQPPKATNLSSPENASKFKDASFPATSQKVGSVFMNPNFIPKAVAASVHVNPNFRGAAAEPAGRPAPPPASGGAAEPGPVPGGAARPPPRRARSSSARYRLLTARKLVRRLSRDGRPPPPARRAAVHTKHKLVRVTSTPRTQRLADRLAAPTAGVPRPATLRASTSVATVSRFKLVRRGPAVAAAAAGRSGSAAVRSQHRTWRRRSSSTSGTGLTSSGSLKLGSTRFVNIGGILYKSTTRKLQKAKPRPSQSVAVAAKDPSPRCISVRGARYRVEAGGRSLRRLQPVAGSEPPPARLDIGGVRFCRAAGGTLTADARHQVNRVLLSRAKSRSLAVLRDSRRLSRQPCRFYCRLGRCIRHERQQCPHVHDPALRPICTRQLQLGGCSRPGCPYNHRPRPEKVPMCLHFLAAECRRDPCPYQHVFVDPDAPLCARFLAGYCPRGQQCAEKHLYICPEFSESGRCPRGAACPLAHRTRRRRRPSVRAPAAAAVAPLRGQGRYYLGAGGDAAGPASGGAAPADGLARPMAEMPSFIAIDDQSSGDEA